MEGDFMIGRGIEIKVDELRDKMISYWIFQVLGEFVYENQIKLKINGVEL